MRWSAASPRHPEEFGHGAIEGVAGPESANNAAASAAFVPMLSLGIPAGPGRSGDAGGHHVPRHHTGPEFHRRASDDLLGFVASMYIGNVALLLLQPSDGRPVRQPPAHSLHLSLPDPALLLRHQRLFAEFVAHRRLAR